MPLGNSVNAATTGFQSLNASTGVWNGRTLTPGTGVTITNGTGTGGDPVISAIGSTAVGATNLGISYSGSTFTVRGATATLSASNVAYVTLQSKTAGNVVTISITADQTFIDDSGASTILGNTFGTTAAVAWGNDMPFFLYAVLNDAENAISFMISRIPHATQSPASANIGKTGSAVADTQGSFFALSNPTVTDYDANPCLCLGSFRMQKTTAATDDWTVTTLAISDGIGQFNDSTIFTYPTGQFGAATSSFFKANGGTAPAWNTQTSFYSINRRGMASFILDGQGGMATSGSGAVTLLYPAPFTYKVQSLMASNAVFLNSAATSYTNIYVTNPTTEISDFSFRITGGTTFVQNADAILSSAPAFKASYIAGLA